MTENPESAAQDNIGTIVGVSIGVLLTCAVVLIVVPICIIVILTLLGPSIDGVFDDIVLNL